MVDRYEDIADELMVFVMQTVIDMVSVACKALWEVLKQVIGHPALFILIGFLSWLWWAQGRDAVIVSVVLAVVVLFILSRVAPTAFRRFVSRPWVSLVRGALVYRWRWRSVALRHGLVARSATQESQRETDVEVAKLLRVKSSADVDRLLIGLPVGMAPLDVEKVCDGVAHAFRAMECRVTSAKPGRVWLEVHRRDALRSVVQPMAQQATADLNGISIGVCEDGDAWRLRLAGTHVLIAGATGSGKGSVLWSLLHGLGSDISQGRVQVWAMDPKGGMELRPGRGLFCRFEDSSAEGMCAAVEDLVAMKDIRAKSLAARGLRSHTSSVDEPHVVVLIDELATLTALADRAVTNRFEKALGLLLTQGRACGITVVAAVQDPGKDVVGWRDLFPTRVALRLDNPIQVDMVLGDGARDRGARADHISELTPGVAYVRVEGSRELRRVRSAYLDDEAIVNLTERYGPRVVNQEKAPTEEEEVA
ncbi:MAG TPA: FtsK/SpoIIIE domain-containing protein [Dermatophilaceae bacterium]